MSVKKFAWASILTFVAIVFCYYFVDRSAAEFAAEHGLRRFKLLDWISSIPVYISYITAVVCVLAIIVFAFKRRVEKWMLCSFIIAISLYLSSTVKDQLKFVFGRYWPATWKDGNPSWINNHEYGFHPFHSGVWYQSFPSGHATAIFASMAVIWMLYPRLRVPAFFLIALTCIGQLGMYFHFVSDIIGGAYLGSVFGIGFVLAAKRYTPLGKMTPQAC